jgi:hypothetical protein
VVDAYLDLAIPLNTSGATAGMRAEWKVNISAYQALRVNTTSPCPSQAPMGYCLGISGFELDFSAQILDITTNTSYLQSGGGYTFFRDSSADSSNPTSGFYGKPTAVNTTFTIAALIALPFNASDHYILEIAIKGETESLVSGWNGTAAAWLNIAAGGHGTWLTKVHLW